MDLTREPIGTFVQTTIPSDTELRLKVFSDELMRWRRTTNLVASSDQSDLWSRHILDSLQIQRLAPNANRWLDIGAGAGFPGIVIAIALYGVPDAEIHCVESDKRKCAFLAHVVRKTGIPAVIHPVRIEEVDSRSILPIDVVTSRAVTSLPRILQMSKSYLDAGAIGIFPQGRNYLDAVDFLSEQRQYETKVVQSITDPESRVICIQNQTVERS